MTVKQFEQYYLTCRVNFFRYTRQFVKDEKAAQDIVSNAFEHCWKVKEKFDTQAAMQKYLYAICRSRSYNFLKYGSGFKNKKELIVKDLEALAQVVSADDEVTRNTMINEHLEEMHKALQQLPDQKRSIIQLAFLEELSNDEVASQLGITPLHVRVAKSKALAQLRNLLQNKILLDACALILLS
ncbi:RNA polymerase sigma factor [Paraflavitalea soli]|uniref:RNA polymerase sigma factor n=1 Tax=Paraflavitalea soli TaxID=2315862 RepID=UPI0013C53766|nr:sigma-70 family RNA polymerase sigma factor [Paraflavitalea soli]